MFFFYGFHLCSSPFPTCLCNQPPSSLFIRDTVNLRNQLQQVRKEGDFGWWINNIRRLEGLQGRFLCYHLHSVTSVVFSRFIGRGSFASITKSTAMVVKVVRQLEGGEEKSYDFVVSFQYRVKPNLLFSGTVRRSLRNQIIEEIRSQGYFGPHESKILEGLSFVEMIMSKNLYVLLHSNQNPFWSHHCPCFFHGSVKKSKGPFVQTLALFMKHYLGI